MKDEKTPFLSYLAIIFLIGCVFGYGIKSYFKSKVTNGPDDRKIVVYKSSFDFEAAKKRLEEEMKKAQEEQMKAVEAQQAGQTGQTGGSCGE